MADPREAALHVAALDDAALETALRLLGGDLVVPASAAGQDLALRARARIERERPRRARGIWGTSAAVLGPVGDADLERRRRLRLRRGLVLAIAATLVLAAVAAASVGFDLPGLRIIFGPPPSSPPQVASPEPTGTRAPGAGVGLGTAVSLDDARGLVDFPIVLPTTPDPGLPDVVYHRLGRIALVWSPDADLPATLDPTIGLLISEFHGTFERGVVLKLADAGTRVEAVSVGGAPGYWIDGEVHFFWYLDPDGSQIDDTYRAVGDTLVWTRDGITYRLETSLGREAAIRLAESLR